ncbi:uncharacterized protein A4U43_C02F13760 [Asparagus officinalis]|uniref:Uncharacterized protein n=1 Tax=Asparagus officinalis TaxID=4686 RepID=A0A5P1FI37_ASPOF|nr:uncharacterized protein A4U43_C02F13760 [Asparagus officinalis]
MDKSPNQTSTLRVNAISTFEEPYLGLVGFSQGRLTTSVSLKMRSISRGFLILSRSGPHITKLLGEVASLRVGRGVGLEQAAKMTTPSAPEVDKLRRELEESQKKAERMEEAL